MKENTYFLPMKPEEKVWGWGYLLIQLFLLPTLLISLNGMLPEPLKEETLNFCFFCLNFGAILLIFHRFLGYSFLHALTHPFSAVLWLVLCLAAYLGVEYIMTGCLERFLPEFSNPNNAAMTQMTQTDWYLMTIGTVVLVPVVEECFYRGLIFRGLYYRSTPAAYLLSILVFCTIHVTAYVGSETPLTIAVAFCQYIPAGLFLAMSYDHSKTIAVPILIHALLNAKAVWMVRG